MRNQGRISLLVLAGGLLALGLAGSSASAQSMSDIGSSEPTKGLLYDQSENELRARKLMRGIANIVLSPAEIPNQAFQEAYRTSPFTGTLVGAGKGIVKGVKRALTGVWEVATFFVPTKNNYEPYIEPEVVMMEYLK